MLQKDAARKAGQTLCVPRLSFQRIYARVLAFDAPGPLHVTKETEPLLQAAVEAYPYHDVEDCLILVIFRNKRALSQQECYMATRGNLT